MRELRRDNSSGDDNTEDEMFCLGIWRRKLVLRNMIENDII
jgi:hypothetical protein